jgi:hypothetical protein
MADPAISVAVFMDYENIRNGLWKFFEKRVPEDLPVNKLMEAIILISSQIGILEEALVFGDWTLRHNDAREISRIPKFRTHLVLRSDSKKDRTDPSLNFAVDDFFRDRNDIQDIILCAGDSDYCELLRRGNKRNKRIYICALNVSTAPELISLAKAFFPLETALNLKRMDSQEISEAITNADPQLLQKWQPLIKQLSYVQNKLPYVIRAYFIKQFMASGMGYGDTFEDKATTLDNGVDLGIFIYDKAEHPSDRRPVKTIRLNQENNLVKVILSQ